MTRREPMEPRLHTVRAIRCASMQRHPTREYETAQHQQVRRVAVPLSVTIDPASREFPFPNPMLYRETIRLPVRELRLIQLAHGRDPDRRYAASH